MTDPYEQFVEALRRLRHWLGIWLAAAIVIAAWIFGLLTGMAVGCDCP